MTKPVIDDKSPEYLARRRRRSLALGAVLGALVLIFYVLTIVKMGPGVFNRTM